MEVGHASPMDTGNPALGAAAGAASAASQTYAAGLRAAQALREAAAQKQQLEQKQRQQQFQDEFEIRKAGGVPYQPYNETAPDPSGLKKRVPNPNAGNRANVMTDSLGRQWLMPDPSAVAQGKNFSDSMQAVQHGGIPVSDQGQVRDPNDNRPRYSADEQGNLTPKGYGLNVPASGLPGSVVTPPGGKQQYYMPTEDEKNAVGLRGELAKHAAKADAEGWLPPKSIREHLEKKAGLQPGSLEGVSIPHEAVASTFGKILGAEKEDKVHIVTNDAGDVTGLETETGKKLWTAKGVGPRRKDPADPNAPKPPSATQLRQVTTTKARALAKAEQDFVKARKAAAAIGDTQGAKEAEDDLTKAKQAAQDEYEQSIEALVGHPMEHVEVSGAGPQRGAQDKVDTGKPGGSTKTPAAQPAPQARAAPKAASLEKVRAYAKTHGMTEAQAIRAAQKDGYTVAGQ